ncbi:L-ribulose-5-phosphate 4-epimerase [Oceanobacillus polygoni]|uniref:L-ribulose-5-phosphate 4-epimerase n=1 Tax=Oceanobacillus polygoni TaxID=1235259 RepID=A0A9X0YV77_9BACI|nr:L-ribulose-5-phosphate 4-epimerase [Oceanobacillus polygoni]MBP2079442.1 L-ribulose-5-phosphate 4-epimerase [Oceanobacillus polygoni]
MLLEELRKTVCAQNIALVDNGLVLWTSGNVSARDPETNYVVIKPSGVLFDQLTPEKMVVVDLYGKVVDGDLKPSVDTASHLYVYRHRDDVHGIVHTHSPYATSFAITGEPLHIYTTTSAAVFGGTIPISDFAIIGEEEIGQEIVEKIGNSEAILIRSHGIFTIGKTSEKALKTSVILEETAQSVHYAMLRTKVEPLPEDVVEQGYRVYNDTYGQKKTTI